MSRNRTLYAASMLLLLNLACSPAERNAAGEIESAGSVDAFTIRVGDCFDDQTSFSGEVSDVPGVPCDQPHDNEVYATFDLTMASWPGEEQANEVADAGCLERFENGDEVLVWYDSADPTHTWVGTAPGGGGAAFVLYLGIVLTLIGSMYLWFIFFHPPLARWIERVEGNDEVPAPG